jgi:hypothetical protein
MLEDRQDTRGQVRGWTLSLTVCRALLAAVIIVLIVGAYYPFSWNPVRPVHNQVTRTTGGALQFGRMNQALTPGTPGWLATARRTGAVQIQLTAEPGRAHQGAPMMLLGSDTWHADLGIMQTRAALSVRVLRPGSNDVGWPQFVVRKVLQPGQWSTVDVLLGHGHIRIAVDGTTRLDQPIPGNTVQRWGPGQISLGDAVHGGTPWQGQIRLAEVRTGSYAVNYIRPGALSIPRSYWYVPDHIEPFPPISTDQWLLAFVDLLTFIPAGFLIVWSRRPPLHPAFATLIAAALAVALAAGKFLFADRHTSLANVLGQVLGALLGALLAWRLARTGRTGWLRPGPAGPGRKKTGPGHAAP